LLFNSLYFNRAISFFYAKNSLFVFPIKKEWKHIYKNHGIKINEPASSILWELFMFTLTVKKFLDFTRSLLLGIKLFENESIRAGQNLKLNSIYFRDLGISNIGDNVKVHKDRNFVNWYLQNIANENFTCVYHNVFDLKNSELTSEYRMSFYRIYHKELFFEKTLKNCAKNIGSAIVFIFKICLNRDDIVLALFNLKGCIDSANAISNAEFINLKTVVFNNSIGSIKPLWATALERRNVFIDYCFYSSSSEPSDERNYKKSDGLLILSSWSNYVVFDELQKQDLEEQLLFHGTVQIAPILPWWSDIEFDIPELDKPTIALFDTALHNQIYLRGTLNQFGWDSPEIALTFLRNILEIAEENNLKIYYKNKRPRPNKMRNNEHFYGVRSLLAKYKKSVFLIDDRVAPVRVIANSFLTISKPLSTTAIIAKSLGKPSVYFDPTGKIRPSDPACRGCKVFSSKQELNKYIQSLSIKSDTLPES
jgi:polysaccharide biosynthesis PFTS motif protein